MKALIFGGLLLAIASGQCLDYGDYAPARLSGLKHLVTRSDKIAHKGAGKAARDIADGVGKSLIPLAPTQWQLMVSPILGLLPDVTEYCGCKGMANCGCCLGFYLKPFALRNNLCLNVSLTQDSNTESKHMVHAKIHYDTYKLIDVSVSERSAPQACLSIPPFTTIAGCIQLNDIHRDAIEEKYCVCQQVSLQVRGKPLFTLPIGCICMGRPVPQNKKQGLFGMNFSSLFGAAGGLIGTAQKLLTNTFGK